jgi:hypothetical protein
MARDWNDDRRGRGNVGNVVTAVNERRAQVSA